MTKDGSNVPNAEDFFGDKNHETAKSEKPKQEHPTELEKIKSNFNLGRRRSSHLHEIKEAAIHVLHSITESKSSSKGT